MFPSIRHCAKSYNGFEFSYLINWSIWTWTCICAKKPKPGTVIVAGHLTSVKVTRSTLSSFLKNNTHLFIISLFPWVRSSDIARVFSQDLTKQQSTGWGCGLICGSEFSSKLTGCWWDSGSCNYRAHGSLLLQHH